MPIKSLQRRTGMRDLDDPGLYTSLDPAGMRERLHALPVQCEQAWREALALRLPRDWGQSEGVVVAGMGGSAIAGDMVADLAAEQGAPPVAVVRDFRIPLALGESTLVIVCSYSGNTQETLSAFHQALEAGARVLAVAGGGGLAEQALAHGVPLLTVAAPGEPRSAVGCNVLALLGVLDQLGLLRTTQEDVEAALKILRRGVSLLVEDVPIRDNPAKQLALELQGKLPVVYSGGLFSGLARRWKTQLNENAKTWAFFESIPEALHNAVEAYAMPPGVGEGAMVLLLEPATEEPMARRYRLLADLLQRHGVSHRVLKSQGGPPLAQLLEMLLLGDYVSYYLALLNGVDPVPTPAIEFAKERLSRPPAAPQ